MANLQSPIRLRFSAAAIMRGVDTGALRLASSIARPLSIIRNASTYARLKRAISAFLSGVQDTRVEERLHQFCRCLDGMILSGRGSGRKDFGGETQCFILEDCE